MLDKLLHAIDTSISLSVVIPAVIVVGGFLWWLHHQYLGVKDEQLKLKDQHIAYLNAQVERTAPITLVEESRAPQHEWEIKLFEDLSDLRSEINRQNEEIAKLTAQLCDDDREEPENE